MFGSEPNVRVHSEPEPEPPFRFVFDALVEPNPEHNVRFGFEHCLQCLEPDRGQSIRGYVFVNEVFQGLCLCKRRLCLWMLIFDIWHEPFMSLSQKVGLSYLEVFGCENYVFGGRRLSWLHHLIPGQSVVLNIIYLLETNAYSCAWWSMYLFT